MTTHSFDVDTACEHGIVAAILLENIRWWLNKNKANGVNAKDGYFWTYNSAEAFEKLFPYTSRPTIARALSQLCEKSILLRKPLNDMKFDKTYWYTIPSEFSYQEYVEYRPEPAILPISQNEQSNSQNEQRNSQNEQRNSQNEQRNSQNEQRNSQNEQRNSQNEQAIPDINNSYKPTDSKPHIYDNNITNENNNSVDNWFFELGTTNQDLIDAFKNICALKNRPISKFHLSNIKAEGEKSGFSFEEILKICVKKNWANYEHGFELNGYRTKNKNNIGHKQQPLKTEPAHIPSSDWLED